MKSPLSILFAFAALALTACSNPDDPNSPEAKAKQVLEIYKSAPEALDKANAVQGQLMDAEARRRESADKAE
jgi:ABC-type oligopeptide transport system substrate-binding subunit